MAGKHAATLLPVITAGDTVRHTWCQYCQEPWRVRVPLYADGQPCGALEVCTGCGATYDQVGIYIQPNGPETFNSAADPQPDLHPRRALLVRFAHALHGWHCRRHGLKALDCAFGDCPWPGLWRHAVPFDDDDGTTTYLFCSKRHKRAWAIVSDVVLPLTTVRLGT